MFVLTKQTLRASIRETPEGRVYYPTTRCGYVLDAATERNLARVLTGSFFLMIGLVSICAPLGSATGHRALVMVGAVSAMLGMRYAALAYVLRRAPRSSVPFALDDAIRRTAATYGVERIWLLGLVMVLMEPATAFTVRNEAPMDRVAMLAISLLVAIHGFVFVVRVLRAKAVMGHAAAADRG